MKRWIVLLLLAVWVVGIASAQDEVAVDLRAQLDEIEMVTSEARGLEELTTVMLNFPTVAELREYVVDSFAEQYDEAEFETEALFYVAFGFMEPDVELYDLLIDLYSDQIAGFYDPELDEMNVILISGDALGDELPVLEQITYAHEYIHALQDQHFDLQALLDIVENTDNPDQAIAILALVEGDATFSMTPYATYLFEKEPAAAAALLADADALAGPEMIEGLPPIIEEELLWPYLQGMNFVTQVQIRGGWEAINSAFSENLPASSEQIYHPDKYLSGEMPIEVTLNDSTDMLGGNWTLLHDSVMGEFYFRQHIQLELGATEAVRAAGGWGGDRYHIYHNPVTGELAWVLRFVGDTVDDTSEFNEVYRSFAEARYVNSISENCWALDDAAMCVVSEGAEGVLMASAPTPDMALALIGHQQ